MERIEVEIIENTGEAIEKYSKDVNSNGNGFLSLSFQDIDALIDGKCIAVFDGEYTTFITYVGAEKHE